MRITDLNSSGDQISLCIKYIGILPIIHCFFCSIRCIKFEVVTLKWHQESLHWPALYIITLCFQTDFVTLRVE